MLETLGQANAATATLSFTESLPDVLNALVQALARSDSKSEGDYKAVRELHRLVAGLDWPRDEFDEKAQLLTHITQLAWSWSLDRGSASEVRRWEEESLKYFLLQEGARQLIGMPAANWSPAVCGRFLSDRACLLALWAWLDSRADSSARPTFELALVVYNWLSTGCRTDAVPREDAYLLGQLSYVLAGTLRTGGRYKKSREWLEVAEEWCKGASNAEALQARIEYGRLAVLSDVHEYSRVLVEIPRLIERFGELNLDDDVAKSKFLQAVCQKETVGEERALTLFLQLKTDPAVIRRPWFKAIVLINLADLQSRSGDFALSLCSIKEAEGLLQGAERPFAEAHCCGAIAEILRDHGKHIAAGRYYRRSVEIYSDAGMTAYAAYARLVLAETLVATGRADEAVDEIVAALPVIESEQLVREGIAAVGLLKASLSHRRLDPQALKALRESLDRSRQQTHP